jgi:hypothetical protein
MIGARNWPVGDDVRQMRPIERPASEERKGRVITPLPSRASIGAADRGNSVTPILAATI